MLHRGTLFLGIFLSTKHFERLLDKTAAEQKDVDEDQFPSQSKLKSDCFQFKSFSRLFLTGNFPAKLHHAGTGENSVTLVFNIWCI